VQSTRPSPAKGLAAENGRGLTPAQAHSLAEQIADETA
jgi:hypothetical protein